MGKASGKAVLGVVLGCRLILGKRHVVCSRYGFAEFAAVLHSHFCAQVSFAAILYHNCPSLRCWVPLTPRFAACRNRPRSVFRTKRGARAAVFVRFLNNLSMLLPIRCRAAQGEAMQLQKLAVFEAVL